MKRRVKQNRWGNWRGYIGNKFVREFCHTPTFLFSGRAQAGMVSGSETEMPEEAQQWLNETANP